VADGALGGFEQGSDVLFPEGDCDAHFVHVAVTLIDTGHAGKATGYMVEKLLDNFDAHRPRLRTMTIADRIIAASCLFSGIFRTKLLSILMRDNGYRVR